MSTKKKGQIHLSNITAAIVGIAAVGIGGSKSENTSFSQSENLEGSKLTVGQIGKVKPMPVLKMNLNDPSKNQFVASHASHRSHSSHSSHHSHRSGAMFA